MEKFPNIKPMHFWQSLLYFGIPAIIATLGIYVCIPALDRAGAPLFLNFMLFTAGPMILNHHRQVDCFGLQRAY